MALADVFKQTTFDPVEYTMQMNYNRGLQQQQAMNQMRAQQENINFLRQKNAYEDVQNQIMGLQQPRYLTDQVMAQEFGTQPGPPQIPQPWMPPNAPPGVPPQQGMIPPIGQPPMPKIGPLAGPPQPNQPQMGQPPMGQPPAAIPPTAVPPAAMPPMGQQGPAPQGPMPQIPRMAMPQATTPEGFAFQQKQQEQQANNYLKLLEYARDANNPRLAEKIGGWISGLGGQYEDMGQAIQEMGIGTSKEKKYLGEIINKMAPEKRAELGINADFKFAPSDIVAFKKSDSGWGIDSIAPAYGKGQATAFRTYPDKNESVTVRINPDGTTEEVGRSPLGSGKQRFIEDKDAGTVFDTFTGKTHKAVIDDNGNLSFPTMSTEERLVLKTEGVGAQEQAKAAGKIVGEQAITAEKDLPAIRKTKNKLLKLEELAMTDWKDAFGKISQLQASLAKISPNWEKRFANATERNRLKAEALKLVPEDVKKMFGPPFSDSDMRVMFEFTGVDLSSQQTFLQALRNSISATENEIDKLERMQQIAAPGVPGAKKKEQQVKEQQTFEDKEKLKNIQERELRVASIAAAREGKTKFTYNGVKYIIVKQGKNYTVMPER